MMSEKLTENELPVNRVPLHPIEPKYPSVYDDDESFIQRRCMQYGSTLDRVIPRLYISDDIAARNKNILTQHKITHILNLTTNIPNKFEPEINYKKIVIFDFESQNIYEYFDESFEFIENAFKSDKNSVLIHCNAGISRSASFVIAYLIQKRIFKTYKEAYAYLKKCRPIISPNRGFERQLLHLEHKYRKKMCNVM